MNAISRRRASSNGNGASLLDGTATIRLSGHAGKGPLTTTVISVWVALAFLAAGCGGGPGKSADDAERYLSTELQSTANLVGATVSDVRCEGADTNEWSCNAFNSLSNEQTYTVRYADGEWSFSNNGN